MHLSIAENIIVTKLKFDKSSIMSFAKFNITRETDDLQLNY